MTTIAIIPARGGSKRIPRKNIKDFLGKPIIAYSIQAALASKIFDEVMVSTDDEEIASISMALGAKVPFLRSQKNSDDYSTTSDVILEVISEYKRIGKNFSYACCIYPTAPFVNTSILEVAFDMLIKENINTVFPVVAYGYPIWRSFKIEDGLPKMYWPEYRFARSQDLPKAYHDAGQFYWLKLPIFINEPLLFSAMSGIIELKESDVQDIDTLVDWRLAELKFQLRNE